MHDKKDVQKEKSVKGNCVLRLVNAIFSMFFYTSMVFIFGLVLLQTQNPQETKSLLGYSMFVIETDSMHSMMPRGTLVITHQENEASLKVGDNITFYTKINNQVRVVTHAIVEIFPDLDEHGTAFATKGLDNSTVDKDLVYGDNVIGKVVFYAPEVGIYVSYIKEHMIQVGVFMLLLLAFTESVHKYIKQVLKERHEVIDIEKAF